MTGHERAEHLVAIVGGLAGSPAVSDEQLGRWSRLLFEAREHSAGPELVATVRRLLDDSYAEWSAATSEAERENILTVYAALIVHTVAGDTLDEHAGGG